MPPPRLGVNNILTPFLPAALGEPLPCQQGLRGFTTREAAEAWGYALHDRPQRDALAGALLGYDDDVLDRLQAQCSA